jgi:leader peptidase (prepilin peptidase) / N-methyltransferase
MIGACSAILASMGIWLGLLALGLLGGFIVNYLADVLPSLQRPGQPSCRRCGTAVPWMDYLRYRACRKCGASRGARAIIVQFTIPASFAYLWLMPPHELEVPYAAVLTLYLALITVIDLEHRLILHITSIAGALLGLAIGIHLHGVPSTLIGGVVGYGIMLAFFFFGELFVRYLSKRRGETITEVALGFGDVNLGGIAGLLLGWPGIVFGLLFTIFAGGIASIAVIAGMLIRRQYRSFTAIPYGPFLVLAIAALLFRP